ncbi:hypothetical protein M0813_18649 [Anaeramoeba flamelloides]|uniref:Uncharacterized protein n=1 Tax=Anaeramoeba flamelloides TaxID=1746091 RepID=A0ABQ8YRR0_9EUKA|nr:hypothetical protein M0813_18649 [Anaeramoeba flamelloides]
MSIDEQLKKSGWGVISNTQEQESLSKKAKSEDPKIGVSRFYVQCKIGSTKVILNISKHTEKDLVPLKEGTKIVWDDNEESTIKLAECNDGMHCYVHFQEDFSHGGGGYFDLK